MAKIKPMRQCPIFKGLTDKELALFSRIVTEEAYDPGTVLVAERMKSDKFYLVEKGSLSVTTESGNGRELILGEGETLGEWALMAPMHLTCATVKVVEKAQLLVLERDDFEDFMNDEPEVALKVMLGLTSSLWPGIEQARDLLKAHL
jgi:CRP-like cAMP-binding protein